MSTPRNNPAPVKLICLGLGRTGTTSIGLALEMLGFGPSYCMASILDAHGKDFATWFEIGNGPGTDVHIPEAFDALFRDFSVVAGYPVAMYPEESYAAYPDAKFILTTRDPATWEKSMRSTILRVPELLHAKKVKSGFEAPLMEWLDVYMLERYHRGRLYTHTQQEIVEHNERIKNIIPPEKLLVFDVGEGWDPLVKFLGVPKPAGDFPHVNHTADFENSLIKSLLE